MSVASKALPKQPEVNIDTVKQLEEKIGKLGQNEIAKEEEKTKDLKN